MTVAGQVWKNMLVLIENSIFKCILQFIEWEMPNSHHVNFQIAYVE